MSEYKLVVTREDRNANYVTEVAAFKAQNRYSAEFMNTPEPSQVTSRVVLDVTLTAEEFAAVKRAAIEASK